MELTHSFTVDRPVERTWEALTDLHRVVPCLPGATLLGPAGDGDEAGHRGAVTVKVGPITARYEGVARFAERDDTAHRAVIRAEGRDVRGQGSTAATIHVRLCPQGSGTEVTVDTDLAFAGRIAQFGRGVVADVSGKLVGRFAERLEAEVSSGGYPVPAAALRPAEGAEPLDLGSVGGAALAASVRRQAVPVVVALLGLLLGLLLGIRSACHSGRHSDRHDVTKGSER